MKFFKKNKREFFVEESIPSLLNIALSEAGDKNVCKKTKDFFYYLFENIFYNRGNIINIQKNYVKYIPQSENCFLDIGCGRGEFLELLKQKNIKAKGIEINSFEFEMLKKDFEVYNSDALTFLKNSNKIFSGISLIQVVEHFNFDYLYEIIKLAGEKIEQGGVIIIETLNPKLLTNIENFYSDFTHIRPVEPKSLTLLLEYFGFKNLKLCHSLPVEKGWINYALVGYRE